MAKKTPPRKKLAKRESPKPAPATEGNGPVNDVGLTSAAQADVDAVCAEHDEFEEKRRPKRSGLPPHKIAFPCGSCGNESAVYVDDLAAYDEKACIALFKKRGSSYKPPLCRWCVARLSTAERKKIA